MINFITSAGPYGNVLQTVVRPIRKHLESNESSSYIPGALNVALFTTLKAEVFHHHGCSDKNYIGRNLGFKHFLVSGPTMQNKLKMMGYENVHVVGWSRLDPLVDLKKRPGFRVLYAPTHNAIHQVSLMGKFDPYLDRFPCEVVKSYHPARKDDLSTTDQALVDADVVISDSSTMIYEAWALGKPVVFCDWLVGNGVKTCFRGSMEAAIYEHQIGLHANSFEEVLDLIHGEIDDKVKGFMEQVFPSELRGHSGEAAAKVLLELSALR